MSENYWARIRQKAVELIAAAPDGIRYSDLHRSIASAYPDFNVNTISGGLHNFRTHLPPDIKIVARGLYRHEKYSGNQDPLPPAQTFTATMPTPPRIREEDFYQSFADWLVDDLEECTVAKALGGNKFGSKWGTPDVMGVRRPRESDIIKQPAEVVSAEIKFDTQGASLIIAFGQACAYKLFSHRSYIVIPKFSQQEDRDRLTALAQIFGIGLVLFDAGNSAQPDFDIQVRAARHEPDYFYVNQNLKLVEDDLFG